MKTKKIVTELLEENKRYSELEIMPRDKEKELHNLLKTDEIITISGVRRCGKSYLILSILKDLPGALYVNFEDERLAGFTAENLKEIYKSFIEIRNPGNKVYFLLDEVQEVKNWEKWVRRMHDSKGLNFILTGSNASLLAPEIATTLGGRNIEINLFPLSFKEFLKVKKFTPEYLTETETSKIKYYLNEYIEHGGFPKVALVEGSFEKKSILMGYFNTIVYKDIVKRFEIRDVEQFREFAIYLIANGSSLMSYYKLKNIFGVGVETVKNYFRYMETAFLIFNVPIFSYKLKDQMKYPRKLYCIDTGLRNAVSFRFMEDKGKLYENIVAVELKRREKEFYYWKDDKQREVDFVIKENLEPKHLVQVCYDIEKPETRNRETKALVEAMDKFNLSSGIIITEDYEDDEHIEGKQIIYKPLWKWLFQSETQV